MAGWQNTSASIFSILGGWPSYLKQKAQGWGALWSVHACVERVERALVVLMTRYGAVVWG